MRRGFWLAATIAVGMGCFMAAVQGLAEERTGMPGEANPTSAAAVERAGPVVIAHRGASAEAPENTLAAYKLAHRRGAVLAECDVRTSADGVPVLLHDATLKRTTGLDRKVNDVPSGELADLDAGKWKAVAYAGQPVPRLAELLAWARGRMQIVLDIKEKGIEQKVLEVIRATGVDPIDLVVFHSDLPSLKAYSDLEPALPTLWLVEVPPETDKQREIVRQALRARVCGVSVNEKGVTADFIRLVHERGLAIWVWTINEEKRMRELIAAGTDGIITDRPDLALSLANR